MKQRTKDEAMRELAEELGIKSVQTGRTLCADTGDYAGFPRYHDDSAAEDLRGEQNFIRNAGRKALQSHQPDEEGLCEVCGLDLVEIDHEIRNLTIDGADIPMCKPRRRS